MTTMHRSFIILITVLLTLLAILAGSTSASALEQPCHEIDDMTLVNGVYDTRSRIKCVYAGPWDVFMGWPGYSPFFFCDMHKPEGTIVYRAVETLAGNVKCVWEVGVEIPEYRHSAPVGFRFNN
jgi:hypothetical protein